MPKIQITAIFLLFIFSFAPLAESAFRPEVFEYKEGRISIKGKGLPVIDLLKQISEIANIQILVFDPLDNGHVSVDLGNVSCHSALKSIIKSTSFAIVYHEETRPFICNSATAGPDEAASDERGPIHIQDEYPLKRNTDALPSGVFPESPATEHLEYKGISQSRSGSSSLKERVFLLAGKKDSSQDYGMYDFSDSDRYSSHGPVSGNMISENDDFYREDSQGLEQQNPIMSSRPLSAMPLETPVSRENFSRMINMLRQRIASGESDREYNKWANIKGAKYITHDRDRLNYYLAKIQER